MKGLKMRDLIGRTLVCACALGLIQPTFAESTCRITTEASEQVAIGMTRAEADAILGCTGRVAMNTKVSYLELTLVTWNEGPHYIIAVFNGGVVLSVAGLGWE